MAIPEPFVILPTPNPNEQVFMTTVRALFDLELPVYNVTRYRDWKPCLFPQAQGDYGAYVFIEQVAAPVGWMSFTWGRVFTDAERATPFEVFASSENMFWPAVLIPDTFEIGLQFTSGTFAILERVWVNYKIRSSQNIPTKIIERRFYASTPWPEDEVTIETLGAQAIEWNFGRAGRGTTGEVLHAETYVAGWQGFRETFPGSGIYIVDDVRYIQDPVQQQNPNAVGTIQYGYPARLYDATVETDWVDYVFSNRQRKSQTGGWERIEQVAIAPDYPPVYTEVALPTIP